MHDRRDAKLKRAVITALVLLLGCGCAGGGGGVAKAYAKPGQLVPLPDGRRINLRCGGAGSPTVLLEAGFGASSSAWGRVQPQLSRVTRVCAYDRAGYGFSDPGPLPRDGAAIARDLDEALTAARIRGPYVVVGHSAGGLYARLFAARRQGEVTGLLLLDPTVERRAPRPEGDGLDGIRRRLQRCQATSEATPQPPTSDARWSGCLSPKADSHAVDVARRPDTWRNHLSELDNIFGRTSDQVSRTPGVLRDVPTYVFTASDSAEAAPTYGFDTLQSVLVLQHEALAGRFRVGSQQTVLSSHLVMIDRPEVVIQAAEEMVRASRAGRPPASLPAGETGAAPEDDAFKASESEADPPEVPGS